MLFQLSYISASVNPFDEEELVQLLKKARAKNSAKNITGFLVYDGDHFFQLLEGEESDVRDLFEVISQDQRHKRVTTLLEQKVEERTLPDWSMQYFLPGDFELKDRLSILDVLASKHEKEALSGILAELKFPSTSHI